MNTTAIRDTNVNVIIFARPSVRDKSNAPDTPASTNPTVRTWTEPLIYILPENGRNSIIYRSRWDTHVARGNVTGHRHETGNNGFQESSRVLRAGGTYFCPILFWGYRVPCIWLLRLGVVKKKAVKLPVTVPRQSRRRLKWLVWLAKVRQLWFLTEPQR